MKKAFEHISAISKKGSFQTSLISNKSFISIKFSQKPMVSQVIYSFTIFNILKIAFKLGICYEQGLSCKRNLKKAFEFYFKACHQDVTKGKNPC